MVRAGQLSLNQVVSRVKLLFESGQCSHSAKEESPPGSSQFSLSVTMTFHPYSDDGKRTSDRMHARLIGVQDYNPLH